ncbi:MAG: hypothetical protein JSV88_06595 [Candidatus Aminicenantes bacterium]|nr:MAG: hypothetical protein JSV88_06595 [Candidatus Aminicenantes bacterium]
MKEKWMVFLILLLCNGLVLISGAHGSYTFSGYLPRVEKLDHALVIKINTLKKEKDFYIYYRAEG